MCRCPLLLEQGKRPQSILYDLFLGMNAELSPKKGMSLAKNRETFSQGHLAPIVRLESQGYNIICILIFHNPPIIHSRALVRHKAAGWREIRWTISSSSKSKKGS